MKRILLSLACAMLMAVELFGQSTSEYRVLPTAFNADKEQQMMRAYQREQVHDALDARLDEFEAALTSPEGIAAYQRKRREYLAGVFGPLPNRGQLNTMVSIRVQRDGY